MGWDFAVWDWLLVLVVSLQATPLAYLRDPKWKAFLLMLPIPFTVATLSVGKPVDATNVAGLILLLLYAHAVRLLYGKMRVPIIPAIGIAALGYCLLGAVLARMIPGTDIAFWSACLCSLGIALLFHWKFPHRDEPGHRTRLPLWIKLPIIAGVVLLLVVMKKQLQGFMTVFPMVTLVAGYEARHCLATISRQIPIAIFALLPMIVAIRLLQPRIGVGLALLPGWIVFMAALLPVIRRHWRAS